MDAGQIAVVKHRTNVLLYLSWAVPCSYLAASFVSRHITWDIPGHFVAIALYGSRWLVTAEPAQLQSIWVYARRMSVPLQSIHMLHWFFRRVQPSKRMVSTSTGYSLIVAMRSNWLSLLDAQLKELHHYGLIRLPAAALVYALRHCNACI